MKDQIENELNIIRAGLDCAPSSSTNNAARRALLRLSDLLLADQPTATETACSCICDGACGCPCHDDEPGIDERRKAKVAPQGAPDECHAGS